MPVAQEVDPRHRCQFCDGHVTKQFARIYGDQDDQLHRCPSCDTNARLSRGSGAGLEVDIPDPQEHPGRWGDRHVR